MNQNVLITIGIVVFFLLLAGFGVVSAAMASTQASTDDSVSEASQGFDQD